ncbi:MAG: hypothetical protein WD802_04450 [Gemmatimonadaceae bacterium]
MLSYTLDMNCLIDMEEDRPAADSLRTLVAAFRGGQLDLAVPAIAASENQRGELITNFAQFQHRLDSLDLSDVNLLHPMAYWDVTFFDHCIYPDEDAIELERRIHAIVHPKIEFEAQGASSLTKWRNAKCDVQAMWSHIHNGRDYFVTSDADFLSKASALASLGAGAIVTPSEAVASLVIL